MSDSSHAAPDPCTTDRESTDRRAFLRDGLMAVAALAAVGVTPDRLSALGLRRAVGRLDGDLLRYPIPTTDGATIDTANKVILVRYQGVIHAFDRECPHRGTAVEWQGDRGRFYCPKHKSTFQPEGTLIQGKAERNLDRYPVRIEGAEIVVDTAAAIRSDRAGEAWRGAAASIPAR
jgi:nitrite reductase/ring-hydroxylating ferredoxin subunit